jgi:hypothetical protein
VRPSGLINGAEWPEVGETVELPESVGADMAAAGDLKAVKAPAKKAAAKKAADKPADKAEKRPAPSVDVEKRAAKKS